jgi:hypothetical protein
MSPTFRWLKYLLPHGLVELRRNRLSATLRPSRNLTPQEIFHASRHEAIRQLDKLNPEPTSIDATDTKAVAEYLLGRGIPADHLRLGSIPPASLKYLSLQIEQQITPRQPLLALHIGNFVGVSLAYLSATLKNLNPQSLTIGIDPNIPHRGITDPQSHVSSLLTACDLQKNTLLITGYSRQKSISNDGVTWENYDPVQNNKIEAACEHTLSNLALLLGIKCDIALVDGNHEESYLEKELEQIIPLMKPGGLIILDDVDDNWIELKHLFLRIKEFGLEPLGTDGRVGIARTAIPNR